MKSILKYAIIVILSVVMVACSASNLGRESDGVKHLQKLANISAAGLVDQCQNPTEVHSLTEKQLKIKVNFARHHKCMGVDEVIIIAWPGDASASMVRSVWQLVSEWASWTADKLGGSVDVTVIELKIDYLEWNKQRINVAFYEVLRRER
jgi:hypothetical protein